MNTTLRFETGQMPGLIRTDSPSTSPSLSRRQPLLQRSLSTTTSKATCAGSTAAEFCGGTTAGCAAVWCCCPCGLVNLLVLAVYKVPAGLCRRALRHRRRKRLIKNGLLPPAANVSERSRNRCPCGCRDSEFAVHPLGSGEVSEDEDGFLELKIIGKSATEEEEEEEDEAVKALEKEMWNRFYGAGFWRSPSQRETVSSPRASKTGMLRGPQPRESSATAVVLSPRTSFTGVLRNTSTRGAAAASPRALRQ